MATQGSCTNLHQLHFRLLEARASTDSLFQILQESALYDRPIAERHRIVFYIGHLEAFDWNLLRDRLLQLDTFSPALDQLFAFGIDPVDGGLPKDQPEDWPSLEVVRAYVQTSRKAIDDALDALNLSSSEPARAIAAETLLNVAIEHRLMHAETLTYMFHQLPYSKKRSAPPVPADYTAVPNEMQTIPAGQTTLGLSSSDRAHFGWDNEFDSISMAVPAFRIGKYMVTNAEFLDFVEDGGYGNPAHWSAEDWQWIKRQEIEHPSFWRKSDSQWLHRSMFEEIPLPPGWPVYVSHAEAGAYARWAGKQLPTEAQWHRAAYGTRSGPERPFPWGTGVPNRNLGNFDFQSWDPSPVNAATAGESDFGVAGQLGNGWEWTATQFAPFPGFQAFEFYPGYSANFFDGKHYVLKGGSARTAACFLRRSFRNWFQPHYPYVYAGFRCVSPATAESEAQ